MSSRDPVGFVDGDSDNVVDVAVSSGWVEGDRYEKVACLSQRYVFVFWFGLSSSDCKGEHKVVGSQVSSRNISFVKSNIVSEMTL